MHSVCLSTPHQTAHLSPACGGPRFPGTSASEVHNSSTLQCSRNSVQVVAALGKQSFQSAMAMDFTSVLHSMLVKIHCLAADAGERVLKNWEGVRPSSSRRLLTDGSGVTVIIKKKSETPSPPPPSVIIIKTSDESPSPSSKVHGSLDVTISEHCS